MSRGPQIARELAIVLNKPKESYNYGFNRRLEVVRGIKRFGEHFSKILNARFIDVVGNLFFIKEVMIYRTDTAL